MNYNEAKEKLSPEEFENYIDACDARNAEMVPYYDLYPEDEDKMSDVLKTYELAKEKMETETGVTKENWKRVYERYAKYLHLDFQSV